MLNSPLLSVTWFVTHLRYGFCKLVMGGPDWQIYKRRRLVIRPQFSQVVARRSCAGVAQR